jgi:Lon-like ATP-dependent protease
MNLTGQAFMLVQFFFAVIIGMYFLNLLKGQQTNRVSIDRESKKEMEKLREMRQISLTEPLSEKTRPTSFDEIIGQEDGLKALRAALCSPNPQHVIVYGPPGIGKTAAARLVLEEAKRLPNSPFLPSAKFIEVDATIARFDERGIADPLIGSVHDPIYQGAGPLGMAGIPQPKPGAVTKAHGGLLFIDEIGELHSIQMNKLLKVLEDRKVYLESAYYSSEDPNVPSHIKDMFENGLPADFRLIGATTRLPEDIPPAIRSRCLEVFFRPLLPKEIGIIAKNAARKVGFEISDAALSTIERYATNGREAVNIIQLAVGISMGEERKEITVKDIEWVITAGQYVPRPEKNICAEPKVGYANGLAVLGPNAGTLIEIEVTTDKANENEGKIIVTGVVDEEDFGGSGHVMRRKSLVKGSVENVLTVLRRYLDFNPCMYDIHINFPGGVPVDGPSAGVAIACAIYSSLAGIPVDNRVTMTGEVSIHGSIKAVGGIPAKVEAARKSGANRILIPAENWQEIFKDIPDFRVIPIDSLECALKDALLMTGRLLPPIARRHDCREDLYDSASSVAAASHIIDPHPATLSCDT